MDNGKLEKHISEWKLKAKESKSNVDKRYREINKILIALEKIKLILPCICIEEHLR